MAASTLNSSIFLKYDVPPGWSLGKCIDDNKVYFIRLWGSGLAKTKPEIYEKIKAIYGELLVSDKIVEGNVVFVPPQRDSLILPRIKLKIKKREGWTVIVGADLV